MQEKTRILKITGEGKTSSSPDTIIITLTISGENRDYQKAMADADNSVMDLKAYNLCDTLSAIISAPNSMISL